MLDRRDEDLRHSAALSVELRCGLRVHAADSAWHRFGALGFFRTATKAAFTDNNIGQLRDMDRLDFGVCAVLTGAAMDRPDLR